ncbi:MAG: ABC transporter permease subunit [Streptosporangiaceae bacterium]|nr:ABC transporter permease subunit [Streptosporangiaceae bacterium]MBV9854199.1 ABC transporter permease subunit [Streptosporangiaceae bacterium]
MSWAARPAAAGAGAVRGNEPSGQPGPPGRWQVTGVLPTLRRASGLVWLAGAAVIWIALLGPVIALFTHLSGSAIASALTAPGALDPLLVSVESGAITLGVLFGLCTPLAWMLARGRLPFQRIWEGGVLCSLLLPPLVIGLLLIFMVGPYTPIGQLLGHVHLTATNTFLALVIAEVYESAPYYVLGAQAAFSGVDPRLEQQAGLLGDRPARVFRRVTLPLAAPGLAMALAVAWARAMGAFGAVVVIAYHPFGIPLQIWTTLQETGLASALPFALVLLVVALPLPLAAYTWSARAGRRRRG